MLETPSTVTCAEAQPGNVPKAATISLGAAVLVDRLAAFRSAATVIEGGGAALVREKAAAKEPTPAVTVYEPGTALAVAVTLATPWALVIALLDESVELAPEVGTRT